jgi:hypothetical protein
MTSFEVEINNIKYFIKFEKQDTRFKKPLDLSIKTDTFFLEQKKYYHIRRRLYNNIICINKLSDGSIRKYQVFNEFETQVLRHYLISKNILFRIIEKNLSYTRKYNILETSYKYCFSKDGYSYENKVLKSTNLYIEVYKGFVNLTEIKDRNGCKYGIYL